MVVRLLIDNGADVNAPRCVSPSSGFLHPRFFLHPSGCALGSPSHHAFATACPFPLSSAPPFPLPLVLVSTGL
jgi:hypothetical protein